MIQESAIVTNIDSHGTWIETQRKSVCGQCQVSKGCGTAVLSGIFKNKSSVMKAINEVDARIGDHVTVGLSESALLKGAVMTYLLPLFYLIAFALIYQFIITSLFELPVYEGFTIIAAAGGFLFGLKQLKMFSYKIENNKSYQPVILHVDKNDNLINVSE